MNITIKKALALIMSGTLCLSMAACSKDSNLTASASETTPARDYINTYMHGEPTTFDVSVRQDAYSGTVMTNTMESLVRVEVRDGKYSVQPGDAASWEANADYTQWTFHLGDNCWSDGEPVTAGQYVYSLQRSVDPATNCPESWYISPILNYEAIQKGEMTPDQLGVQAVDDKTLVFTLSETEPEFLAMMDGNVYYPQRADIYESAGEDYCKSASTTPCNGPYYISSWTAGESIVIEKNTYYQYADSVAVNTINYAFLADSDSVKAAFEEGNLDYVSVSTDSLYDYFDAVQGLTDSDCVTGTQLFAFFNTEDSLFSNTNIRKAFCMSIDRTELNEACFDGMDRAAQGFVAAGISDGKVYMDGEDSGTFRQASGQTVIEDKAYAKTLLLEGMASLGLGEDPSELTVSLALPGNTDWYRKFGEYLKNVWETALGINVSVSLMDSSSYYTAVKTGRYQIAYTSWGVYYNDPYDALEVMSEDMLNTGWKSDTYNRLLAAAEIETDSQKRLDYLVMAEQVLMDEAPVCPLVTRCTKFFVKSYIHDTFEEFGGTVLGFSSAGWTNCFIDNNEYTATLH